MSVVSEIDKKTDKVSSSGAAHAGAGMDRVIAKKKNPLKIVLLSAAGLAIVTALYLVVSDAGERTFKVNENRLVISSVTTGTFEDFIPVRGRVTPLKTVFLDAMAGGRVERRLIEDGAMVEAGQPIVNLSNTQLQLDVMRNEAAVTEQLNNMRTIELQLEQNRLTHKRNLIELDYQIKKFTREVERKRALYAQKNISKSALDEVEDSLEYFTNRRTVTLESQRTDARMQEQQLKFLNSAGNRLEMNLQFARDNMDNLNMKAPVAGKLSGFNVEIGQSINAGERITGFEPDSDWDNISIGNMTYVLLPDHLDGAWLENQVDGIQERMVPEERAEIMTDFTVNRMQDANLFLWRAFNLPVMTILKFLGLMVLIVACINYTNLATAQSMSRTREVGLRKTMGASRKQLLFQFMIESLTIASLAMALALAVVELIVPAFNSATGKALAIGYFDILPWVLFSTLMVGLLAGAYPAILITKTHPIDALRDSNRKGAKGALFRSLMIGTQFFVSVVLLAMVSVLYMQNQKVEEASNIYPKKSVYTISRIGVESIEARHETLRNEMVNLPGVMNVSFSSQVPFEQNNSSFTATPEQANEAMGFSIHQLRADHDFLETYNIPILAGRSLNREIARDTYVKEVNIVNVLVNEMAVSNLGFASNEDAIGKEFYDVEEGEETTVYVIAGVMPDQNILGFHNTIKPWVFFAWPEQYRMMSICLTGDDVSDTVKEIENVWDRIVPDYPMQGAHLNEKFREIFKVFRGANAALAGFAMLALLLALIGLFGLAAFMAEQRTKEIGIRKVMGASSLQIAKLLVLKFSKPVIIAAPLALILAFFGAQQYLNFFADRIDDPYWIVLASGVVAIFIAWVTVAAHAIKVARANPINALHYE